jgi:hypothetical protein
MMMHHVASARGLAKGCYNFRRNNNEKHQSSVSLNVRGWCGVSARSSAFQKENNSHQELSSNLVRDEKLTSHHVSRLLLHLIQTALSGYSCSPPILITRSNLDLFIYLLVYLYS